jgi:hypothetical protein
MSTIYDGPSWCEAVAAGIEVYNELRKQAPRSAMIKRAHEALIQEGDIAACKEILAGLVKKTGAAAVPELPGSKTATWPFSKADPDQREEFSIARLIEKRNRLADMLGQLRALRGKDIGKAAPAPIVVNEGTPVVIWQRLSKADIARKAALARRIEQLREEYAS